MDGDEERTTNHTILTYPTLGTPCTGHPGQLVPGEKWVRVWRTLWCCCQSQWVRKHRPCPGRCLGSARLCSWSWLFLSTHRHYSCLKEANAKCWIKQGSKKRKISLVMDFLKIIWQWQYSCATETKKGQKFTQISVHLLGCARELNLTVFLTTHNATKIYGQFIIYTESWSDPHKIVHYTSYSAIHLC